MTVLAGHAKDRERGAAVGGDVDLDNLAVQAQQVERVGVDLRTQAKGREHEGPIVVRTQAQPPYRNDHARGDVAAGLVHRVLEASGEQSTGQDNHHSSPPRKSYEPRRSRPGAEEVDPGRAQHVGVEHAAAAPLDPLRPALGARVPHVQLGRGLGEREVVGPQPDRGLRAAHLPGKLLQGAFEVGHRQTLVYAQALDPLEDGGVRGVELVSAVGAPGDEKKDRQLPLQQRAHMHRRGVGA